MRYRKHRGGCALQEKDPRKKASPRPLRKASIAGTRRSIQSLNPSVTERQCALPLSFWSTRHSPALCCSASLIGAQRGRDAHLPDCQGPRSAWLCAGQVQLRRRSGAICAGHDPAAPLLHRADAPEAAAHAAATAWPARPGPVLPRAAAFAGSGGEALSRTPTPRPRPRKTCCVSTGLFDPPLPLDPAPIPSRASAPLSWLLSIRSRVWAHFLVSQLFASWSRVVLFPEARGGG